MPYLSFLGEPKLYPSHGQCVNSSVTLGPERLALWTRLVRHKRGVQKKLSSLLTVPNPYGIHSGWFEVWSWSWTNILNNVVGRPTLGSTFVWSNRS